MSSLVASLALAWPGAASPGGALFSPARIEDAAVSLLLLFGVIRLARGVEARRRAERAAQVAPFPGARAK